MNIELKENEGFIKISMSPEGTTKIDYGYNITPPKSYEDLEDLDIDDMSASFGLVSLICGLAVKLKSDPDTLIDIGMEAIDAGMLEDNLMDTVSADQLELALLEPKGNA
jgi:hypothetical protein